MDLACQDVAENCAGIFSQICNGLREMCAEAGPNTVQPLTDAAATSEDRPIATASAAVHQGHSLAISLGLGVPVFLLIVGAVLVLAYYWRKQAQVIVFRPVACSRRHQQDRDDPEDPTYQPAPLANTRM